MLSQAISETNQGLTNSKVNIRVHLHCVEEAKGLTELRDEGSMLRTFRSFKGTIFQRIRDSTNDHNNVNQGSVDDLRQTADVAMLLVSDLGPSACGVAYFNSPSNTVGIVDIRCALG